MEEKIKEIVSKNPTMFNRDIAKLDGSKNNYSYFLHTEGFERRDIEFLQELLHNKFGIETSIHQLREQDIIYIKGQSRKLFIDLITPYICESMKYKLLT